jgi:hypothetical protein
VVDVVEHNRAALGCDAARETPSDWNADTLLHLFLEPDRGARDELIAGLVEQQDRGRVCLEDVPNTGQELAQELVEVEMGERGVPDELETSKPFCIACCCHVSEDMTRNCERRTSPEWVSRSE